MPDRPSPSTMPSAGNPLGRKPVPTLVTTRSLDLVGTTFWVPLDLVVDDVVLDRQSMKDYTDACSTHLQAPLLAPQPRPAAATQRPHPRPADLRGLTNRLIYFVAVSVVTMSSLSRRLGFPVDCSVDVGVLENATMKDCTNANATMKDCTRRCGVANVVSAPQTRPAAARLSWARLLEQEQGRLRGASRAGAVTRSSVRRPQQRRIVHESIDAVTTGSSSGAGARQARRQEAEARRIAHESIDAAADREAAMEAESGGREGSPGPRPGRGAANQRRCYVTRKGFAFTRLGQRYVHRRA